MIKMTSTTDNSALNAIPERHQLTLQTLSDINNHVDRADTLIKNLIHKVRSGALNTVIGISFLELKCSMLLSYLMNVTHLMFNKCSGKSFEGDSCIERLLEIRTVLEKIRPIDYKLKYQVDKLIKTALQINVHGADDTATLRANPDMMGAGTLKSDGEESDDAPAKNDYLKRDSQAYVPSKISAVAYPHESKSISPKKKSEVLSASFIRDIREEYLDVPDEIVTHSRSQNTLTREQREREQYEEEYFTRLPIKRGEKREKQLSTVGTVGDEIIGAIRSEVKKRKKRGCMPVQHKKKKFHKSK